LGLEYMLDLMNDIDLRRAKTKEDYDMLHEIVRCIRAFLNNKVLCFLFFWLQKKKNLPIEQQHGIKAALSSPNALNIIFRAIDSTFMSDKETVLEIMSGMCFVDQPTSHQKVLDAMKSYQEYRKEERRFQSLVNFMSTTLAAQDNRENSGFLVTAMIFINSLITGVDDLDLRIHVRNEFYQLNFASLIKVAPSLSSVT